jgi:hypothetical protein
MICADTVSQEDIWSYSGRSRWDVVGDPVGIITRYYPRAALTESETEKIVATTLFMRTFVIIFKLLSHGLM